MVEDLIKKEEKLKYFLEEKEKVSQELKLLKEKDNDYINKINDINSTIKTNYDFQILIANFYRNRSNLKKEIIRKVFAALWLIFSVTSVNYVIKYLLNFFIKSSLNAILIFTIIESIILINYLIIIPCSEYKNVKESVKNMELFTLDNLSLKDLKEILSKIKSNHELINHSIKEKENYLNNINYNIDNLLFELINDDRIKDLLIKDLITDNKYHEREINLILEDYDKNKEIIRKR